MSSPLFIDFEASCLPRDGRSFPIEVGLADGRGWSRAWLIRPAPAWRDWTWTAQAEALHGIAPDQLVSDGTACAEVMTALNAAAAGREVIADHDLDRYWLAALSDAAGVEPAFRIAHIAELLDRSVPDYARIARAVDVADRTVVLRHRARLDALWLATFAANLPGADAPLFDWSQATPLQSAA